MNRAIGLGNWCVGTLTALILAVGIFSAPASAQVKPGDFITPDNAYKVKDLVSPGQYLRVMHGMTIKVTPTERIDWPPPYKDATEKYSSQVRLTPDHRSLVGYVAGEPFPIVDANDPDAGTKVMWNVAFRPISSDEYDLRWFDCDSVYWGKNAPFREITDIEVGHYAGYNEVGRTEVDPMPIDPDFKDTGRYFLGLLYPVLAPQVERGTGLIKFRYADPYYRGRQLDVDARRSPRPPPELRHSRLGQRSAGLRPESLRRLQRQERKLQLENARREEHARARSTSQSCPTFDARQTAARAIAPTTGRSAMISSSRAARVPAASTRSTITKLCTSIRKRTS